MQHLDQQLKKEILDICINKEIEWNYLDYDKQDLSNLRIKKNKIIIFQREKLLQIMYSG